MAVARSFWIVWSPQGSHPPRVQHASEMDAEREAERLARQHAGSQFYVLCATRMYELGEIRTVELVQWIPAPEATEEVQASDPTPPAAPDLPLPLTISPPLGDDEIPF